MTKEKKISIFDTTLRDGAQTRGVNFTVENKITITKELDDMGFDYIEGGWPGSNPKDIRFFREMKKITLKTARLTSFSSTRLKNTRPDQDTILAELLKAETPVFTIFGKSWDLHVTDSLGTSLEENLDMISSTVEYLKPRGDEVIYDAEHFFDGYRANPEYAIKTILAAVEAGADWIVLCDTNGGSLPQQIRDGVNAAREALKHRENPLGIHTHNDGELAIANTLMAVEMGCTMVQGTINGLGERCGNANLCSAIPAMTLKLGLKTIDPLKMSKLMGVSSLVSEFSNKLDLEHLPYVGERAFTHKGGIHVSAIRKNPRLYEHIPPESVGNQRHISISDQAGKSNIMQKAGELGMRVGSADARMIASKVKELEAAGYHFEDADASFELLSDKVMQDKKTWFTVHGFRVHCWETDNGDIWSEATIKLSVPEGVAKRANQDTAFEHTAGEGSGPVEAMDIALHKALEPFYSSIAKIRLIDFRVRILDGNAGTKAIARVLIQSTDGERIWGTVGVSESIIEASWHALVESIEYKLKKEEEIK